MKIRLVSNNRMRQAEAQANLRQERNIKDYKKKIKSSHADVSVNVGDTDLNGSTVDGHVAHSSPTRVRSQSPFLSSTNFGGRTSDMGTLRDFNRTSIGIDASNFR